MRVPATILSLLAVAVLLLPWQLCTCSEDGTHLKPLWETSDCPQEHEGDGPDEECTDLVRFPGTEAECAVALPAAERHGTDLEDAAAVSVWTCGRLEAALVRAEDPGDPPRALPPLATKTRLQV